MLTVRRSSRNSRTRMPGPMRCLLLLAAVLSASCADADDDAIDRAEETSVDESSVVSSNGGLKQLARTYDILWGGVAQSGGLETDATYRSQLAHEFNVITPENELKMKYVQAAGQGRYDWADADRIVNFTRDKGLSVHGHTLVWHKVPSWVESLPTSKVEGAMRGFIDAAAGRYRGRIWAWDVVNEALNYDGSYRDSVWSKAMGTGYIAKAYWTAHRADPNAKLLYNDYDIETKNSKSDALYEMVKRLKAAGVPFHGIALQMHKRHGGLDYESFAENIRRFGKLGVEVYISEMDVQIDDGKDTAANLSAQADVYWNVLDRALQEPAFKGFQTWGISDKYSFIADLHPLPMDAKFRRKPAYGALENRLSKGGKVHTYQLVNKATGAALHVEGNSKDDAARVVQYRSEPTFIAQKWKLDYVGGRAYHVKSVLSGRALKVVDGADAYGARVEQYAVRNDLESERWELIYAGNGYHALRNQQSGRLLGTDSRGDFAPVIQANRYGGPSSDPNAEQLWRLVRVD